MDYQALSPRDLIGKFPWGMSGSVRIIETFSDPHRPAIRPRDHRNGNGNRQRNLPLPASTLPGELTDGKRHDHRDRRGTGRPCPVGRDSERDARLFCRMEAPRPVLTFRGGAPGTFGTDTLNPLNLVGKVNGLFFSGGSAFGLSAADGVRRYLKERDVGFDTAHGVVPIVAGAIIFDLGINKTGVYPDADLAFEACRNASPEPVQEGSAGAGLGATVGKLFGFERCMKGGVGSSILHGAGGLKVGALMVVNAFGEVFDPDTGMKVAGARKSRREPQTGRNRAGTDEDDQLHGGIQRRRKTVIGAIVTNAQLNKVQLTKVAQMAHDGLAEDRLPGSHAVRRRCHFRPELRDRRGRGFEPHRCPGRLSRRGGNPQSGSKSARRRGGAGRQPGWARVDCGRDLRQPALRFCPPCRKIKP